MSVPQETKQNTSTYKAFLLCTHSTPVQCLFPPGLVNHDPWSAFTLWQAGQEIQAPCKEAGSIGSEERYVLESDPLLARNHKRWPLLSGWLWASVEEARGNMSCLHFWIQHYLKEILELKGSNKYPQTFAWQISYKTPSPFHCVSILLC